MQRLSNLKKDLRVKIQSNGSTSVSQKTTIITCILSCNDSLEHSSSCLKQHLKFVLIFQNACLVHDLLCNFEDTFTTYFQNFKSYLLFKKSLKKINCIFTNDDSHLLKDAKFD